MKSRVTIFSRTAPSVVALILCLIASIVLTGFATGASAATGTYTLTVYSEFGPYLSDADRTKIVVTPPYESPQTTHFDCDPAVTQNGNTLFVAMIVRPGAPTSTNFCDTVGAAFVGPLNPGPYQVNAQVLSATGVTLASLAASITVTARGAKCNPDPVNNQIIATPLQGADIFHSRYVTDASYRAKFGDVTYLGPMNFSSLATQVLLGFPTLEDPVRELAHLQQTGEFRSEGQEVKFCFDPPPPDDVEPVVEYYNTLLDHYFMTPDAGEQAAIDAGKAGPGWVRTGKTFMVVLSSPCPGAHQGNFHPVYRFAGIPNIGPNSHFFTVSQDECAVVRDRTEWHWQFEGAPFWATEPAQGVCPAQTKSLYRAYNNGKGGTANHRYSTDPAVIATMVAQGWVNEGVAMCVAQ